MKQFHSGTEIEACEDMIDGDIKSEEECVGNHLITAQDQFINHSSPQAGL